MPRPRFDKLPADLQRSIVAAARDEFATHGFNAASLNRIIDAAGISKGSMYYYFDGKEDLYAHVARVELGRLFEALGPFPVPSGRDADAFWSAIADHYRRIMEALSASPQLAALARDWAASAANPALQRAQRDMERDVIPWFEQAIASGQRVRAVRDDLPGDLLIAVAFGMGQAMDAWLLAQRLDDDSLRRHVGALVDMIRRALGP